MLEVWPQLYGSLVVFRAFGILFVACYIVWKTIRSAGSRSWWPWVVGVLKWKMCSNSKLLGLVFYPEQLFEIPTQTQTMLSTQSAGLRTTLNMCALDPGSCSVVTQASNMDTCIWSVHTHTHSGWSLQLFQNNILPRGHSSINPTSPHHQSKVLITGLSLRKYQY